MPASSSSSPQRPILLRYEFDGRLAVLEFNNPTKYNPFSMEVYRLLTEHLRKLATEEGVVAALLTGKGPFYSSGNQMTLSPQFQDTEDAEDVDEITKARRFLQSSAGDMLDAFIDFPKPLIAAVNGPAVGVACTSLGLCDFVYASDKAWFQTPFMKLGFCAEGCSSVLFPEIMGPGAASEMLLLGKRFTAAEAKHLRLVTEVFPASDFRAKVWEIGAALVQLPPQALMDTKALIRSEERREFLHRVNGRELDTLARRMCGEECQTAVMKYFMEQQAKKEARKKKQKKQENRL